MRTILGRPDTPVIATAAALLAVGLGFGLVVPSVFAVALAASVVAGGVFFALRFPAPFCAAWLLVAGMSLEMAFADLVGPDAYQPTIAIIKGAEIGLALLCVLRFGPRLDPLCPAWAFPVMLVTGLVHGLYPGLSTADSLRSAVGSVTPFAFCFVRVPRSWADTIVRTTKWCPTVAVLACLPLAVAGIRP
ncbi:MAG TPA: hypothetical protein VGC09_08000, partial [Rhodopila sp.]